MAFLASILKDLEFMLLNERFGEYQIKMKTATAGDNLYQHIVNTPIEDEIAPNSFFEIISYNFPRKEWAEDTKFIELCRRLHENKKVKVRAVGGPEVEAIEFIKHLYKEGIVDGVKLLVEPRTYHIALLQPKILWIEDYHYKGEKAKNCIFAAHVYDEIWKDATELFGKLWTSGKPLEIG